MSVLSCPVYLTAGQGAGQVAFVSCKLATETASAVLDPVNDRRVEGLPNQLAENDYLSQQRQTHPV